jgi:hypothetical protein
MCNAMDQSGNSGHTTWRIGRVTGKCIDIIVTNCKLYAGADSRNFTRMVADGVAIHAGVVVGGGFNLDPEIILSTYIYLIYSLAQ